jgi:hypothetical protein
VLTRYREAYHEEALRRGPDAADAVEGAALPAQEAGADDEHAAPSIHEIEEAATLDRLPPEDLAVRVLVRERVLPAGLGLEFYAEGTLDAVWTGDSFKADEAGDAEGAALVEDGKRFARTFRTTTGPTVEKHLEIRSDGTVIHQWRWSPADFPEDAWFAPEVSLGADVALTFEPSVEAWRYPIVTTSKCPDGFEEIEQGMSVTPRWPASFGEARMVIGSTPVSETRSGD